jgi:hypothetical protein
MYWPPSRVALTLTVIPVTIPGCPSARTTCQNNAGARREDKVTLAYLGHLADEDPDRRLGHRLLSFRRWGAVSLRLGFL